jgi:hypothetical protein
MTRAGFLLAKWASHMLVFAVLIGAGLVVGPVAQWIRAEDRHFDLIEAIKPILLLSLPACRPPPAFAVWFDLVPWLRRTAGNVLFFVLWIAGLSLGVSQLSVEGSPARTTWLSEAHGLMLVGRATSKRCAPPRRPASSTDFGFNPRHLARRRGRTTFEWKTWQPRPRDSGGRALWLGFSLGLVLLAAPLLDRARRQQHGIASAPAAACACAGSTACCGPSRAAAFGVLAVRRAQARAARARCGGGGGAGAARREAFGSRKALAPAMLLAWGLPLDLLARGALREGEHAPASWCSPRRACSAACSRCASSCRWRCCSR